MDYGPSPESLGASAMGHSQIISVEHGNVDMPLDTPEEMIDQTQQHRRISLKPTQGCLYATNQALNQSVRGCSPRDMSRLEFDSNHSRQAKSLSPTGSQYLPSSLEDFPMGYPRMAYFMDNNSDLAVYRRFGYLHSRLLGHKQDQLRKLEDELSKLDCAGPLSSEQQSSLDIRYSSNGLQISPKSQKSRDQLFEEIEQLLLEYGLVLKQAQDFQATSPPHAGKQTSLINYFNYNKPNGSNKTDELGDGLVHVTLRMKISDMGNVIGRILTHIFYWLRLPFTVPISQQRSADLKSLYSGISTMWIITSIFIAITLFLPITTPIFILWALTTYFNESISYTACISAVLDGGLALTMALTSFTKVERREIIAASLGYTAVLVVFIKDFRT